MQDDCYLPTVSGALWPGVSYFCSTRQGGVSLPPYDSLNLGTHVNDNVDNVARNRMKLQALLPAPALWLNQVHGVNVAEFHNGDSAQCLSADPQADAAITTCSNCVLAILTADCLPVVIADEDASVLGVAHAGWRGLAAGVLENTLLAMRKHLKADRALKAWVGPGISQPCFEVGPEVRAAFVDADPRTAAYFLPASGNGKGSSHKWFADLPGLARYRLNASGVDSVALSNRCTFREADLFYSYRRTPVTGRMATVAWLQGATN